MANKFLQYLHGKQRARGERKLVQKLDFFILTFCCLMYFVNYLGMCPAGSSQWLPPVFAL